MNFFVEKVLICTCISGYIYVCRLLDRYINIYLYVYIYLWTDVYIKTKYCPTDNVYICLYVWMCVCMCVYVYVCVYICMYMYVYVCICVYVYIYI